MSNPPKPGWSRHMRPKTGPEPVTIRKRGDPGASPAFKTWKENDVIAGAKTKPHPKGLREPIVVTLPFIRTTVNYQCYGFDRDVVDKMRPEDRPALVSLYLSRYKQPDPSPSMIATLTEGK